MAIEKRVRVFQRIAMTHVVFRKLILEGKLDGKKQTKRRRARYWKKDMEDRMGMSVIFYSDKNVSFSEKVDFHKISRYGKCHGVFGGKFRTNSHKS